MISSLWLLTGYAVLTAAAVNPSQRVFSLQNELSHMSRIIQPKLCDDGTKQYSGYIPGSPLFFWFFESRSDPQNDPIGLWLNGGPGSSSLAGMDYMGPCKIVNGEEATGEKGPKMQMNEWGWNRNASILMIDNPKGAGFSQLSFPATHSTYIAAVDLYQFLQSFFRTFPQYAQHELAINSLSYGGHYVPVYSGYIMHRRAKMEGKESLFEDIWDGSESVAPDKFEGSEIKLNLLSVSIGNGWFAPNTQMKSWIDFVCGEAEGVPPLLSKQECLGSRDHWKKCEDLLQSCVGPQPGYQCGAAGMFCSAAASYHYLARGYNPYDYRTTVPYPETLIQQFYNDISVQHELGVVSNVSESGPVPWNAHSVTLGTEFQLSGDFYAKTDYLIERVLRSGVDILIYEGMVDWICNSLGMRDVMSSLPSYSHQQAFNRLNYTPWLPLGEKAGAYKCIEDNSVSDMRSEALESRSETGGTLCYLEMDGAGHIVAKDKPKEAVQMISGWMKHRSLK